MLPVKAVYSLNNNGMPFSKIAYSNFYWKSFSSPKKSAIRESVSVYNPEGTIF